MYVNQLIQGIQVLEDKSPKACSIIYQIFGQITYCTLALLSKLFAGVSSFDLILIRSIYQLSFSYALRKFNKISCDHHIVNTGIRFKVILRSLLGMDMVLFYYAIVYVNLSEVFVLCSLTPLWVALIVTLIQKKQKFRVSLIIEILVCLLGVIFVAKPPFFMKIFGESTSVDTDQQMHILGVIIIVICSISFAFQQIILKEVGQVVDSMVVVDYLGFVILSGCSLTNIVRGAASTLNLFEHFYILVLGLLGFSTQFLFSKAFGLGNVTQISFLSNIQIILGLFVDYFILNQTIDKLSLMGSGIILICIIYDTCQRQESKS